VRRSAALVCLAALGLVISLDLAAFQLGFVRAPWEPLFGDGSRRVLTSSLSRLLPVPDAAAGAAAYLVEGLLGAALLLRPNGIVRVATALAAIACVGALVGIALVGYQLVVVGAACTLCIASAVVSCALAGGALLEARDRRAGRQDATHVGADLPRRRHHSTDQSKESLST
jgi:uncharacterized membrane protein